LGGELQFYSSLIRPQTATSINYLMRIGYGV